MGQFERIAIETCLSPYVKQMTSESLMHEAGHNLWDNLEGRGEEVGGGSGWGTCALMAESRRCMAEPPAYC